MKFVLQPLTIRVTNCDAKSRMMEGSVEKRKHGEMLPSIIRAIICPLNYGKINVLISLLESPNGIRFENVYVSLKSLQQPKYRYLENLFTSIDEIGYFTFSNNSDVVPPTETRPNSIFIFDDVACDKRDAILNLLSSCDFSSTASACARRRCSVCKHKRKEEEEQEEGEEASKIIEFKISCKRRKIERRYEPVWVRRSKGRLLSNRGYKYKHKKKSGKGLPHAMTLNDNAIDYMHWDDPNELVDCLRLLDASYRAGNNAHDNKMLKSRIHETSQSSNTNEKKYLIFLYPIYYASNVLTVIDVLSKYAWTVPLKSKGGSETANAIAEIVRESRCPKNLQTDMGKEFYNVDVQKILKKHDVNHCSTDSTLKASVVERFNRTLKNDIDIWNQFTHNGNYKWIDLLLRLISEYNARKHRTTTSCIVVNPNIYLVKKMLRKKGDKVYMK
ncbi:YMD3 protein, partial [Pseudoatta argentina]